VRNAPARLLMLELRFRPLGLLLLLLRSLFGPWRHDAIHAHIGNGLTKMFADMSGDHDSAGYTLPPGFIPGRRRK
jgi:hypothetical protein